MNNILNGLALPYPNLIKTKEELEISYLDFTISSVRFEGVDESSNGPPLRTLLSGLYFLNICLRTQHVVGIISTWLSLIDVDQTEWNRNVQRYARKNKSANGAVTV